MFAAHTFALNIAPAATAGVAARATITKTTTIKGWLSLVRRAPFLAWRARRAVRSGTVC